MAIKISTRYPGRSEQPTEQYPTGSFKNRTSPEADNGTPVEQAWANDALGARDALFKEAGITPNGSVDTAVSSQWLVAAKAVLGDGKIRADLAGADGASMIGVQPSGTVQTNLDAIKSNVASEVARLDDEIKQISGGSSVAALPMFMVAWCPNRAAIWPGWISADGQELPRQTYQDASNDILSASPSVPVVADSVWISNPDQRGCFTRGSGGSTIRVPDYNGKYPGSIGAVFLRGDGTLSAGSNGVIQRDAMQRITGTLDPGVGNNRSRAVDANGTGVFSVTATNGIQVLQSTPDTNSRYFEKINFDSAFVARTASETRALNVTGCWVIRMFGAVANPGSADAAQLASDYATLASQLQILSAKIGSTIIYPNGGSQATPASISVNSRYIEQNPFPGFRINGACEILVSGEWQEVGFSAYSSTNSLGVSITQSQDGRIMIETGISALVSSLVLHGYSGSTRPNITAPTPARVRVWKVGAV